MIFYNTENNKKIIFIIGSGRSGTHLIGRTLGNSNQIEAYIEDKFFFNRVTRLATGINRNKKEFKSILKKYKKEFSRSKFDYILEKTHPNIWFVEELVAFFPEAKFIGIKRSVFSTVASMLNHKGVLRWYEVLPQNEVNPFLGITDENKSFFDSLPLESKCALRWKSHSDRLAFLKTRYPDKVLVVDYDEFYDSNAELMRKIEVFMNFDFQIECEELNQNGKVKWKDTLTDEHLVNIEKVIK